MIVNSVTLTTAIPRAAAAAPAPLTAAQAIAALKKNPSALIAVSDSAANISKNFDFLATSQKNITSLIFSTADSNLKLSYKQYSTLSGNDSFLPSTYKVEITTATSAESVQAFEDEKVSSISINDAGKVLAETVAELNSSSIDNYIS